MLDLVITNEENVHVILNIRSTEPLGMSDHIVLTFDYCFQLEVPVATYTLYLYDKGDYESINEKLLNEDWTVLFRDLSISAMWEVFHSKLLQGSQKLFTFGQANYLLKIPKDTTWPYN